MTVTVTHRGDGKGYLLIRADGRDVEGVGRRYVPVHRLVCYGHGLIEDLGDEREVHHRDGVPCNNGVSNLEPLPPEKHGEITAEQVERRVEA